MIKLPKPKLDVRTIPPLIALVLVAVGVPLFWPSAGLIGNVILLALVIAIVPWLLYSYIEMTRIAAIEDAMPAFMLDLAETQRAGLTLPDALRQVAKTDYGRLTAEIKTINNQISWGIPFEEAMSRFAHRMRKSDMIRRVVRIINEAYLGGGDIARTMDATAHDIMIVKEVEKERRAMMASHVAVMYAIYFIFIGIIIGLSKTLIPMLQLNIQTAAIGGIMTFQDPCVACAVPSPPIFCVSCVLFGLLCAMFGLGTGAACYYRALFLLMAIVQGICAGLVAGQIGEGRVLAGFKHSAIMTGSGFAIIIALLQLGLM
jgi:flagellar protein FlaJ